MKKPQLIFYLDDDTDDLEFFKESAVSLGHHVSLFMDGHELLQTLKSDQEKPDIIFLDIHMPILNGEEILNIIKKSPEWRHIPVVMISGAYPKKLARQFLESGANYLKKKPGSEMRNALEEVLKINWNDYKASA